MSLFQLMLNNFMLHGFMVLVSLTLLLFQSADMRRKLPSEKMRWFHKF